MNRLSGMRGYLGGAMEHAEGLGVEWRQTMQEQTADLGVIWLDPTNKPIDIGIEDIENHEIRKKLKSEGRWDEVTNTMKVIRCVDLRMVDIADFLIINLDVTIHTSGTYEELFLANRQKKPIILHVIQGKHRCPDWIFATIPHQMIFDRWQGVKDYLRHIAYDPIIEKRKRWYFFNFDEPIPKPLGVFVKPVEVDLDRAFEVVPDLTAHAQAQADRYKAALKAVLDDPSVPEVMSTPPFSDPLNNPGIAAAGDHPPLKILVTTPFVKIDLPFSDPIDKPPYVDPPEPSDLFPGVQGDD